jgi:hypothetical protein
MSIPQEIPIVVSLLVTRWQSSTRSKKWPVEPAIR